MSTEFERYVIDHLTSIREDVAAIQERTADYPDLRQDVADIKGRTRLLEFKASSFGAAAGALVIGVKAWFGRG